MRFAAAACAFLLIVVRPAHAQLQPQLLVTGLQSPVAFVQDPTDRNVQLVVQQAGRIRVVRDGAIAGNDFLNLTSSVSCCGERGLLGLAFAPDYASSGRFYVNFTNTAGNTVVARFLRSSIATQADPSSRFDLQLERTRGFVTQPFSNHNGGHLAFGPDGYLYIGLGDGGSGNDPDHRAQNPNELLGKMLRIDVNVPDADPVRLPNPAGQSISWRQPGARRNLGIRSSQPVALQLRRRRAWRHGRAGHRRRRPEQVRGNQLRAARSGWPQLRLAQPRGGAR